jgi:hypothetical protein
MANNETSSTLRVTPVAGHIGADITGVDIARPLTDERCTRSVRSC